MAVPTDTIYGLACLVQNNAAVSKIYEIKGRHHDKPIAMCVTTIEEIYRWCHVTLPEAALRDLLPGPVTLVFRRLPCLNPAFNPSTQLVGVRIPDDPFVRTLSERAAGPLALTSANPSNQPSSLKVEVSRSVCCAQQPDAAVTLALTFKSRDTEISCMKFRHLHRSRSRLSSRYYFAFI